MNKNLVITVVVCVVVVLAVLGIKKSKEAGNQPAADLNASVSLEQKLQAEKDSAVAAAKEVEAQAKAAAEEAEAKAQAAIADAQAKVEQAAKEFTVQAGNVKNDLMALIEKAKELLKMGDFQGAINAAQNILTQDPDNADAKSILQQAQQALSAIAKEQMKNAQGGVQNVLGGIGK